MFQTDTTVKIAFRAMYMAMLWCGLEFAVGCKNRDAQLSKKMTECAAGLDSLDQRLQFLQRKMADLRLRKGANDSIAQQLVYKSAQLIIADSILVTDLTAQKTVLDSLAQAYEAGDIPTDHVRPFYTEILRKTRKKDEFEMEISHKIYQLETLLDSLEYELKKK
jgi:hypothetical protein